jgi:NADPH-dependent 2,4-dienoyl-CoA reductase/sulfur reductase-like enzyme
MEDRAVHRSVDPATHSMLRIAEKQGIETVWERLEAQQPQCGYGELGLCCRHCNMGPCRIDPFDDTGPQKGVCGANADTLVARGLLRAIAAAGRLYAAGLEEHKPGVYNFKSLTAAEDLLERVKQGHARTALIIGAGFIGVEIALLLRGMGLAVTQLVRCRVMRRMLDPETSEVVLGMLQERGVKIRRGDDADAVAFVGEPRAQAVEMRSGDVVSADLLVAATGLRPNVEFLKGSGIEMGWGVLVDDQLRTNVPDIYAAGDVAETFDRLTGERYVHAIFPNAVAQAKVVAYNTAGMGYGLRGRG